jgi:hypothetical protein
MAIAVETTFRGGTREEYDGLLERLGFRPQRAGRAGLPDLLGDEDRGWHPRCGCLGIHGGIHSIHTLYR